MSFKVPSITYNVCALEEVVLNKKTGLSLPINIELDKFVDEIIQLIENPKQFNEMKSNCLDDFNLKYSPTVFVRKLEELSERIKKTPS